MLSKVISENYIKEAKRRHNNYTGNYKMDDKDFNLYLEYIGTDNVHTYQGFKDFKINKGGF